MSRQRSIVHLSGQFDDMQLSIDGKKAHAKLVVPVSKEKIMTSPDFEGTRKVMAEFKGASLAVDSLQKCLCGKGYTFGDRYLRGRLQRKLNAIVRTGAGVHGERPLEVVPNAEALKGIPIDNKEPLKSRFRDDLEVTVNLDRNTATLVVAPFEVLATVKQAQGATHFRLFLCVGVLSDFQFVGGDAVYAAVNPAINGKHAAAYTPYMITKGSNAGFQLVASVPTLPILPSSAGLVVSVGIEYYYFDGTNHNTKAMGNAMEIVAVF